MANKFLNEILDHKRQVNQEKSHYFETLKKKLDQSKYSRYGVFKKAISKSGVINLIAEIKKASPSKGMIREDFDVLNIAKIYSECKASAFSILTEDKYFLGKPAYIKKVSDAFNLPILIKDFIIHEGQIYEAYANGASAILLIASILDDEDITYLMSIAASLDIDVLVEIHNQDELSRVLNLGAEMIGINNRNLDTLKVDMQKCVDLIPEIPKDKIIVAESGIKTHKDIQELQALGANAVIIGEVFMAAEDIESKVKEVFHGQS